MSQFKCLVAFEFSKYSSCYEVMNQIQDLSGIHVFEVSPTPSGGILILAAAVEDQLIPFYFLQKSSMGKTMINSCLIINLNEKVLAAYLSQNTTENIENLNFFETNSLCEALEFSQKIANLSANILDFRLIRSLHNRAIVVYSGNSLDSKSIKITNPTKLVKSYFEILK